MTTLLVASTGGHLEELRRLRDRLPATGSVVWVTFDTPQSRSLLASEDVEFVPFVGGRDPMNVLRNVGYARRLFSRYDIETVVSTGSAVAIPYFAVARRHRCRAIYIESAARITGPSLSAKIISTIPGVELYCQYRNWTDSKWHYGGSVFDGFEATTVEGTLAQITRVVVTLGTYQGFSFHRLLHRLLAIMPSDVEVLWQTGDTDVSGIPITAHRELPARELDDAMARADVIVAHAGVGTALRVLELDKCPVLVPRRAHLGEHVDDHQIQIANELRDRGLAVVADADDLTLEHFATAARTVIRERHSHQPLSLSNA